MTPSDELRKLLSDSISIDTTALTNSVIQKLGVSSEITQGIQKCLSSDFQSDISTGFLFLNALLGNNQPKIFGDDFFRFLVDRLEKLLEHESKYVCYQTLELYIWLKDNYPNYKDVLRKYIFSDDLGYRKIALYHCESFVNEKELSPLIRFSQDDYAAEKGMNSELFYELRDLALEKISKLVGKQFCGIRLSESHDGTVVSWYDWAPFYEWWEENKANYE